MLVSHFLFIERCKLGDLLRARSMHRRARIAAIDGLARLLHKQRSGLHFPLPGVTRARGKFVFVPGEMYDNRNNSDRLKGRRCGRKASASLPLFSSPSFDTFTLSLSFSLSLSCSSVSLASFRSSRQPASLSTLDRATTCD